MNAQPSTRFADGATMLTRQWQRDQPLVAVRQSATARLGRRLPYALGVTVRLAFVFFLLAKAITELYRW